MMEEEALHRAVAETVANYGDVNMGAFGFVSLVNLIYMGFMAYLAWEAFKIFRRLAASIEEKNRK